MSDFRLFLHIVCVVLGYIGSFEFALCNIPAIIKIKTEKTVKGVSFGWIVMSLTANLFCASFVLDSNLISGVWQYPLYFNYGVALFCCIWLVKLYRKYK